MVDLGTGMYVGCVISRRSEIDAFRKAVGMLKNI